MTLVAENASDRAAQLIELTKRLTHLMRAETEALEARELDASSRDWEEKERLAHTYRMEMAQIADHPEVFASLSEGLRLGLLEQTQTFQSVLRKHGLALQAMREISEGLVATIATEISEIKSGPVSYGATGRTSANKASGIALNAQA